jgi:hypothetical protein
VFGHARHLINSPCAGEMTAIVDEVLMALTPAGR